MRPLAVVCLLVAVASAILGFKIAIGVVAIIAKILFFLALVLGIGLFAAGVKAGKTL
jgi:uncharacterized membrane protein YtjA (UPF0391 family)